MRPSKPFAIVVLLSITLTIANCSTDPKSGVVDTKSLMSGIRFEHRTERRSDGKTLLVVTPASGVAQDRAIIEREAQTYAEAHASRTCPTGYDFYAHAALMSRKGERTFVFQCK